MQSDRGYSRREVLLLFLIMLSAVSIIEVGPDEDTFPSMNIAMPPKDALNCLAATAWMENRGGRTKGMQSVMNVIVNRAMNPRWWGKDIRSVCLMPYQFSCWNPGSPQIILVIEAIEVKDPDWINAVGLAAQAIAGILPDITGGADSYYDERRHRSPVWATSTLYTGTISGQRFYRVYLPIKPLGD